MKRRIKADRAIYHCMTRTVNGEHLFGNREKEMLRKMLWQVADFSGVEVLTYCVMANHFHVLVRVPPSSNSAASTGFGQGISDEELLRRYRVLYPKPTKYQMASHAVVEKTLASGGDEAEAVRKRLLARMGDVSEYMKTLKQRFSVWFNGTHGRFGTLWAERFKSVLVEGRGNPLQTVAAYIDLNPVRAGIVTDPKDYRFCGYAEAVAHSTASRLRRGFGGQAPSIASTSSGQAHSASSGQASLGRGHGAAGWTASAGICFIWRAYADGAVREGLSVEDALRMHRELIFGTRAGEPGLPEAAREEALKVLKREGAVLPKATVLRCRVRYFTDGAILGSEAFVRSFIDTWQRDKGRKHPPKPRPLRGADWGDLVSLQGLKQRVFQ